MALISLAEMLGERSQGRKQFDLAAHHREKIRHLEQVEVALRAEERKLYRLLTLAARVATREGEECGIPVFIEALCALDGSLPERPAWVEEQERRAAIDADLAQGERFLTRLKEMA